MDTPSNMELGAVTVAAGKVMILYEVSFDEVFQEEFREAFLLYATMNGCPKEKAIQAFDEGKEQVEDGG